MRDSPAWEQPFLEALAATGNARLSAARAGVDHTTAYQRRLKCPQFAEAWAQTMEGRAGAAVRAESASDAAVPGPRFGELVERVSANHGPQIVRTGIGRWSKRAEQTFLTELAACANLRLACAAAGFSTQAMYKRRAKDRRFAEAWDAAIAMGRTRIEAYLVEAADRTFDPHGVADGVDLPKMTIAEAIKVVQLGQAQARSGRGGRGEPSGRGWIGPESWDDPDDEEAVAQARENIINRLQRIRERDEEEKLAAGWTRVPMPGADGNDPHEEWAWVPPGYAQAADARALPGPEGADSGDEPSGPRVRGL